MSALEKMRAALTDARVESVWTSALCAIAMAATVAVMMIAWSLQAVS